MSEAPPTIALALVSHTNVGKTTLARTLLARDVGEVLDQAHVTDEARGFELERAADGARLELWDTPGFGDSARLARLLRDRSIEWFLAQPYDRHADRALWCGQRAVETVRARADVVLYLVNAIEEPDEAGYVAAEMELFERLEKPVLVLLNQTGPPRPTAARGEEEQRWRAGLAAWPVVRDVLELDAFARCWVEEGVLLERVRALLPPERRPTCDALLDAWRARRRATFEAAVGELSAELARAAADRERVLDGAWGQDEKQARRALGVRLEQGTARMQERLIALHGLEGRSAVELRTALTDFVAPGARVSPRKAGLWGGVISGLGGGLAADVLSGGMTFGGGMILGGLMGGLGAAGLARAYTLVRAEEERRVTWSEAMLERTVEEYLLRYLAVAHFGRGRGAWREREHPAFWRRAVEECLAPRRPALRAQWAAARALSDPALTGAVRDALAPLVAATAREALARFFPAARRLF